MKHTKKLLAAVMALTMVSAVAPMSAFADTEVKQNSTEQSGEMKATYDVEAKYTVTIPAGVTLNAEAEVTSDITAENVLIAKGKQVVVKLTGGTYTTEGSTFHAKKGDSTAEYKISAGGSAVSVGGTVATFRNGTDKQTATLTFSKPTGWTEAGEHTETLTFGISVEDAVVVKTLTVGDVTLDYCDGDTWQQIVDRNPDKIKTTSGGGWEVRISKINGSFTSWNLCKGSIGNTNFVYANHVVDPNATYVWWE